MIPIHVATFLFGLAGLFGKWVELPAIAIVFGRVFFAGLFLFPLLFFSSKPMGFQKREDGFWLAFQGALLALHWVAFFQSIQMASVAVGLLTFATFPVFTTALEPFFEKRAFSSRAMVPAGVTLAGVYGVVPAFELSSAIFQGALWGLLSGFTFALLSLVNRRFVRRYHGGMIALWQDGFAALFLFPFLLVSPVSPTAKDLLLLLLLGAVLTGVSHTLFIQGMRHVSARRASIVASLEPFYGIGAAALFLGEVPSVRALLGGALILLAAFWVTLKE